MKVRSFWILATAIAAVVAIGFALASRPRPVSTQPANPSADVEYESENVSTAVRQSVLDASNMAQLIANRGKSGLVKGKVHPRTSRLRAKC